MYLHVLRQSAVMAGLKVVPVKSLVDGSLDLEDLKMKALARIPTCAVFHKLTPGQGVPHSFVGEYRMGSIEFLLNVNRHHGQGSSVNGLHYLVLL